MSIDSENPIAVLRSSTKLRISWDPDGEGRFLLGTFQRTNTNQLLLIPSQDEPLTQRPVPGQSVSIEASTPLGIFEGVAHIGASEHPERVAFRLAGKLRRIQRRQYERIQIAGISGRGWLLDSTNNPIEEICLSLLDLSGGGIRFATPSPVEVGARVRVPLALVGEPVPEPTVILVDSFNSSLGVMPRYVARGYFQDLTEKDRDRVINFVIAEQLNQRGAQVPA